MKMNLHTTSFKDFENMPAIGLMDRAEAHGKFLHYLSTRGYLNYRLRATSGCGAEVSLWNNQGLEDGNYVNFVCNDYLGFTQHPKVKERIIENIRQYGTGAGASPLIGGHFDYHEDLENKLCSFFKRPPGSALIYTTGYTSNSSSLQSFLKKEDIAIADMAVHASVFEGLLCTNTKRFPHNDLGALERILRLTRDTYRTKLVIVDGVYSQDGDVAKLKDIYQIAKNHGALIMVDDAHGVGVIGRSGRGLMEREGLLDKIDIISGTFSKTFANIGGYVIAQPQLIEYLQYQSRQYAFSASSTPAIVGVSKAIDLIDEEPLWKERLWENIDYFKSGLQSLGLDTGTSESAIVPVKIGDPELTCETGKLLLRYGVYTNPIMYPAVALKDARIRMSVIATHTKEQLDKALNAFDMINGKLYLAQKEKHVTKKVGKRPNQEYGADQTKIA